MIIIILKGLKIRVTQECYAPVVASDQLTIRTIVNKSLKLIIS